MNHSRFQSNDEVYTPRIKNGGTSDGNPGGQFTNNGISGNNTNKHTQDPTMRSHVDTEHLVGAPAGEAGQLFDGAPGFVTQGDLLAMIGPALTARGDTFLIRAYGDAGNAGGPNALDSRAWLEAVVQRVAEPVTPAGTSGEDLWRPTDVFGRRFKVVSMRWLTSEEI
jgi:hypothetical protein